MSAYELGGVRTAGYTISQPAKFAGVLRFVTASGLEVGGVWDSDLQALATDGGCISRQASATHIADDKRLTTQTKPVKPIGR